MPSSETNDAALFLRIAGGDHIALQTLHDRYAAILLALAQHILGAGSEAQDVVHDTLLEVWRSTATYDPQHGTVRTWLILRCRELSLEALRASEITSQMATPTFLPNNWAPRPRQGEASMEDPRFGQERSAVQAALAALSDKQRTIMELAYFDGMPQGDIAARVNLNPAAVHTQMLTAQHALRAALHDIKR